MRRRYMPGTQTEYAMTLLEVAREMKLSPQRISALEATALKKLRERPARFRQFIELVNLRRTMQESRADAER